MPTDEQSYTCPSLNSETKLIENNQEFCENLEAMKQYDPNAFGKKDDDQYSLYRVYNFVGKEVIKFKRYCELKQLGNPVLC